MKNLKLILLFASLAALFACQKPTEPAKKAARESKREIKIGATVSMSGKFSTEIGPFKKLMDAWAAAINHRGGLYVKDENARLKVKFVVYDDKSDGPAARRFYERLITKDKVDLLIGPYSSPLTFAASVAAEEKGVPFIAICANSPKVYSRGFKWIACVIDAAPRYTYRYWEMVAGEKRARSVAFVVEDTLHPVGVYKGAKKLAQKAGLRDLGVRVLPPTTHDFTATIVRLKELSPDIIFVSANVPFGIAFMRQARELDLRPKEFHVIHHGGVFRKALGKAAELVVGQSYWTEGMDYSNPELFLEVMDRSRVVLEDFPWAPAYMMGFEVAAQAIERAGTLDNNRLMAALKRLNVMTIGGVVNFKPNGVGTINTYPSQIIGGKYHIVWPPSVATADHRYPAR